MTLDHLRAFIEIAQCGSLSKAAEKLYTTQPNLTKSIAALENELGFSLFQRHYRGMALTKEGKIFMERTELLFFDLLHGIEDAKFQCKQSRKYIRVGVSREERIPKVIMEQFVQINRSQNTSVLIEQDTYRALVQSLVQKDYDMIFTTDRYVRNRKDLQISHLRKFSLVLAVSREHPLGEKQDLTPLDLSDQPIYIALPDGKNVPSPVIQSVFMNCGGRVNLIPLGSPVDCLLNVTAQSGAAIVSEMVDQKAYSHLRFVRFEDRNSAYLHMAIRADESDPAILSLRDRIEMAAKNSALD